MASKVIKIGNSTGISVPKADLTRLGLSVGDTVSIKSSGRTKALTIQKSKPQQSDELARWTDTFIEQYRPALEALAKK